MSLCLSPSPYMTAAATMATAAHFLQFTGRRLVAMVITRCLAALVFLCLLQCWNKTLWVPKGDVVVHGPSDDIASTKSTW